MKKKTDLSNRDSIHGRSFERPVQVERELFKEGEDPDINQQEVQFTHWNSGIVYSGVVESNFMLLGERHCRVFVNGQKKPFTVKYGELNFPAIK